MMPDPHRSDVTAAGLSTADHPLLGAAITLADGESWVFTGRLSLQTQPWLTDHSVLDSVLLPGTAFVELALTAGSHVDCDRIEELLLEEPLTLLDTGAVQVQVSVGGPNDEGLREVSIHARVEEEGSATSAMWTRHATGILASSANAAGTELQRTMAPE